MTVRLKDVAKVAGVSPATVSRALGKGPISQELRSRVERAVKTTGYRPNLSARRLRSRDSGTVGLIVADIRNPFFTAISRAVENQAYKAGLRVILCNTDEDPKRESINLRLMQEERVTGVILASTQATGDALQGSSFDFPLVLIDRAGPAGVFDSVVLDNRHASATLVDHLFERGYRRIGGLFGNTSSTGIERSEGYVQAMQAHRCLAEVRFTAPHDLAAEAAVAEWLASPERPDALIVSNSRLLMGALRAARSKGVQIPRDLALAGFDNEIWTELVDPGITVIEQPVEAMGHAAVSMLLERQRARGTPARKVVLSGRCIIRGSTGTAV